MKSFFTPVKNFIQQKDSLFLGYSVVGFILLRLPSLIEPYWYGDEGIYAVIGMAMRQGRVLYREIWDNKPPFLYLIYTAGNGDLFFVRFLSIIFGIWAVIALFFLAKILFISKKSQYIATILFAILFGLPFLEGNIANAENFMLAPIITSFYMILSRKKFDNRRFILAGFLFSFAFLFKVVALFDFIAAITIALIIQTEDSQWDFTRKMNAVSCVKRMFFALKKEVILTAAFMTPILVTAGYFAIVGVFPDFFRAVFSQNVGYVEYGNKFIIPQGMLIIKAILLSAAIFIFLKFRKLFKTTGTVIFVWLAFALFSAFFSQRPYTHYVLVVLPSVCLLAGYIVDAQKIKYRALVILIAVLFVVTQNFGFYKKIFAYYNNYFSFITGKRPVAQYQAFFDKNTPRDYEIARFLTRNTQWNDSVFLWSDSGQIYALSNKLPPGRYIVAYHITFYPSAIEDTKAALNKAKPKYIVDTKRSQELQQFIDNYTLEYKIGSADIYERQF